MQDLPDLQRHVVHSIARETTPPRPPRAMPARMRLQEKDYAGANVGSPRVVLRRAASVPAPRLALAPIRADAATLSRRVLARVLPAPPRQTLVPACSEPICSAVTFLAPSPSARRDTNNFRHVSVFP